MIILGTITDTVRRYVAYSRAKTELRALDDRMLSDIGVTRSDIDYLAREAAARAVAPAAKPADAGLDAHALHPAGQH